MAKNTQTTEVTVQADRNSDEYLRALYNRLDTFELKLDEFLKRSDADITEISEITGYITSLKREIAQIESDRRKNHRPDNTAKVLYDNQSILATSTVRRKVNADLTRTVIYTGAPK